MQQPTLWMVSNLCILHQMTPPTGTLGIWHESYEMEMGLVLVYLRMYNSAIVSPASGKNNYTQNENVFVLYGL